MCESIFCHHRPELVYNHDLAQRYPECLLRHILLSGTWFRTYVDRFKNPLGLWPALTCMCPDTQADIFFMAGWKRTIRPRMRMYSLIIVMSRRFIRRAGWAVFSLSYTMSAGQADVPQVSRTGGGPDDIVLSRGVFLSLTQCPPDRGIDIASVCIS